MSIQTPITPPKDPSHLYQKLLEEAALRRVAEMVAAGEPESAVIDLVVHEATELLPRAALQIVRNDDPMLVRELNPKPADREFAVDVPIVVRGTTWGALVAIPTTPEPLENDAPALLTEFADPVSRAITNRQAFEDLDSFEESRGALRRVATLVAQGAMPETVFDAIAVETSRVLGVGAVSLLSYDPD